MKKYSSLLALIFSHEWNKDSPALWTRKCQRKGSREIPYSDSRLQMCRLDSMSHSFNHIQACITRQYYFRSRQLMVASSSPLPSCSSTCVKSDKQSITLVGLVDLKEPLVIFYFPLWSPVGSKKLCHPFYFPPLHSQVYSGAINKNCSCSAWKTTIRSSPRHWLSLVSSGALSSTWIFSFRGM